MEYVVGCGVGSQGVKVVLLSVAGLLVGEASASYASDYPHPTWAEQSAEAWLSAITDSVRALTATTGAAPDQFLQTRTPVRREDYAPRPAHPGEQNADLFDPLGAVADWLSAHR